MSEIVERVARSVDDILTEEWNGDIGRADLHVRIARAAIEAMREPTKRMVVAASKSMSPGHKPDEWVSNHRKHTIRYQAMIDAALGFDEVSCENDVKPRSDEHFNQWLHSLKPVD